MLMVEKTQKAVRWLVHKDSTGESPLTAAVCMLLMMVAMVIIAMILAMGLPFEGGC